MQSFLRSEGVFVLLIFLVVLASFSPVLFFGKVFFDEEQLGFYYVHSYFFSKALSDGASLSWNNSYYAGVPVQFEQFVSAYFPVNRFLFSSLPFIHAHHWSIFLGALLGCLAAYWFGRANVLSQISSFVLAVSYLLATTLGWLDIGTLAAWSFFMIPALFLALFKAKEGRYPLLWILAGSIFLASGFLAGFLQIVAYGWVLALIYAIWLDFSRHAPSRVSKERNSVWGIFKAARALTSFFWMSVIGGVLGSPQILPSLFMVGSSIRTNTYALQNVFPLKPFNLVALIFPEYFQIPFLGGGSHGFYVGALPFLALILGFFLWRRKGYFFWGALYLALVWVAFHLPPLSWLNDYLPPFSRFSSSARWSVAAAWPLAVLAGLGFEGLLGAGERAVREEKLFRFLKWSIAAALSASITASAFLYFFARYPALQERFLLWYFKGRVLQFPFEHYFNIFRAAAEEARSSFSVLDWRIFIPLLLLPAAFFIISRFRDGRISRSVFIRSAAALTVLNVLILPAAMFKSAYVSAGIFEKEPQIIKVIKARENDLESFRIMGFLIGDSVFWELAGKKILTPEENARVLRETIALNLNTFYGIDRLDGAWYYRTLRHNRILNTVLFPRGLKVFDPDSPALETSPLDREYNNEVLKTVALEEKVADFLKHLPLASAFNVKYIYSLIPLDDSRLEKIADVRIGGLPLTIHLYENKTVLPRVYFAKSVKFWTGKENELLREMSKTKDFGEITFVECASCPAAFPDKNSVEILHYENRELRVKVSSEAGGWLVFGESFMPGWEARVDGADTPIYRANYILQGIYVPAGKHKVEFKYTGVISQKWKEIQKIFLD